MASGSTGAPHNIPFPVGADTYALTGDLQAMASQVAGRLTSLNSLFDGKLTVGQKWSPSDNLNSWWQAGVWGVAGAQGMPEGVTSAIMLQVQAGQGAWQRLWISFGVRAGMWLQWGNQVQNTWHPATPFKPSDVDSALAHELRVQELQRRRGRTVAAKGVVVFVLDHGYNGFMSKAWPDLQARGFPVTWALNTTHPTAIDTGDTGIDWAAIKNLAAANPDGLEIAAHSANHGNVAEREDSLRAAIIDHKTELETRTGQKVDSWVQPGNTLGDFTKDNGGSPEMYAGTTAGRMIAATYACATGYILTPRTFALDGVPDLGVVGSWLDTGVGGLMTYVNSVATNGGYTIVRLHPQYMDQAGYITRAQWQGVLDQIKALVDAGSIEVMTLRDAAVATPSPVHRHTVADVTDLAARLAALEYDTGWRRLTPAGPHLTGDGAILFRRIGSAVYCRFEQVGVAPSVVNYSYLNDPGFIPAGFRPEYAGRPMAVMSNSNANPVYVIGIAQGSRFRYQTTIGVSVFPGTGSQALIGQMSWSTLEPRPATLPGTPA